MTWHQGDPNKQPDECKALGKWKGGNPHQKACPNLKETEASKRDMEGETYNCEVCGEYVFLDYEEMR